jgi:MFS transporter, ACS family, hexuronate transporter
MAGKYRFVVAALLFFAGSMNFMDRAAIGILGPYMQHDLRLDASAMGIVFSTFFMGYSLFTSASPGSRRISRDQVRGIDVWHQETCAQHAT